MAGRARWRRAVALRRDFRGMAPVAGPPGQVPCGRGEGGVGVGGKGGDGVGGGVSAGSKEGVALVYCVERVIPLLDGCVAGDLGCKCTVGRKVLVEEAEELFKCAEGTE